jgi:hypothetical protein
VFHVVEHGNRREDGAARGERKLVEIHFHHGARTALDPGYDDDDFVEIAVEDAVSTGEQIGKAAEGSADQYPLVVKF